MPNDPNTILGSDRLVFDTSGAVISGGKGTITIPADAIEPKLAKDITMEIHLGDLTQFGESTSVVLRNQNGLPSGALDSIAIDRSGIIIGSFSNGMTKNLAQVALARFDNPAGLLKAGNSIFQESNNSGQRVFGRAESGGYGSIMSNALEMSNVDLSEEFTDMIITQRGFQANSRIITSSDEMLQEVVNLKR